MSLDIVKTDNIPEKIQNVTIYQIYSDKFPNDYYIGSSINFVKRKYGHKKECNNPKNNCKVYQFIRENGGFSEWNFKILKEVICSNNYVRLWEEQQFIELMKPSLNQLKAQKNEESKLKRREYMREYIYKYNEDKVAYRRGIHKPLENSK